MLFNLVNTEVGFETELVEFDSQFEWVFKSVA